MGLLKCLAPLFCCAKFSSLYSFAGERIVYIYPKRCEKCELKYTPYKILFNNTNTCVMCHPNFKMLVWHDDGKGHSCNIPAENV